MSILTQHRGPKVPVQPFGVAPGNGAKPPGPLQPPVFRRLTAWLAGTACLLLAASAARAALNDRSPTNCTGSGLGITLYTSIPDVHIGDTLYYSVNVFNGNTNSGAVACDASSIVAFITTPDGKSNNVALVRTTLTQGQGDFYPAVASYVVRAQDIQPDGTLKATAQDIGIIHQNIVNSSGGANQGVNTEVNQPCVLISALCFGGAGENGLIHFTGTVTNCGNNTLVGVTVTNFVNNGIFTVLFPTNLALGQTANFSGSWVPANPCGPSTAVLTVLATDQFTATPRTVTSLATIMCQNTLAPGIAVTEACPAAPVAPGQTLTYSGTVTNTGNVTLTNVVVVGNEPGPNTVVFTAATLAPGAGAAFTGSYIAPSACVSASTVTATGDSLCGVGVTASAGATCPIVIVPSIEVTLACPSTPPTPLGLITYSGIVLNDGVITLTNVVVVNPGPGGSNTVVFTVASLAPRASANFTFTKTVPPNCCTVFSEVVATGVDVCGRTTASDSDTTTCTVLTAPKLSVTEQCPPGAVAVGALLTFKGAVANTGNTTIIGVTVADSMNPSKAPLAGPIDLAPGQTVSYSGSYIVPPDFCGTDTVTATGSDLCSGAPVTGRATAACPILTTPRISVVKICPSTPVPRGGLYVFTGYVTNSGNVTLTNVFVVDDMPANPTPVLGPVTLAPGVSMSFSGSYTAPLCCCEIVDTLTASGQGRCDGTPVTSSSSAVCPLLTTPGIALVQICPPNPIPMGTVYGFSGLVTNTGDATLTNVFVFGPQGTSAILLGPIDLSPGEAESYAGFYTVPFNVCSVSVTTAGQDTCSGKVTSNAVACPVATTPLLTLSQTCPAPPAVPGGLLTYSGSVSNAGNITLTNVLVLNSQSGATPVFTIAALAPGAAANFTGSYVAPTNCSTTSISTATGTSICGVAVTNTVISTCPITTAPLLSITQNCPAGPVGPGGLLTYGGTVSNAGNITLTNVVVMNNLSGATPVFTAATLAPGAAANFTGSYVAPTNCSTTSISTATGSSICGAAVTNTASANCPVTTAPLLSITQNCPAGPVSPGGLLSYSGTVRNAGNITLNNVVVTNSRSGTSPLVSVATLAPGASANFTGSYTAPASGPATSVSTARATSLCGAPVTNSASSTCALTTTPGLAVTKLCPAAPVAPGASLVFSGTVTNTGNVTLTNVIVVDSQPAPGNRVLGPITLAVGTGTSFTGSYPAPLNACSVSDTLTATGNDAGNGGATTNTASANCPLLTTPLLTMTQNCPASPVSPGGLLTYSGTVSNAGNITLNNIVVTNSRSGITPLVTVATLAPGASANFTGSYTAPASGPTTSVSTARATSLCGVSVTNSAGSTCALTTTPGLTVTKLCPAAPVAPGASLVFSGTVTNTGNVTLTNVVVVDSQPAPNTPVLGPITLAPGAGAGFTGSYAAPLNACSVSDTLTATANDAVTGLASTNTASANCPLLTTPLLTITQNCPASPVSPGGLLGYSGTVSNAGNITLNNVVVTNSRSGTTPLVSVATLAPGASANFTGSYTAPASGPTTSVSTARATSLCGVAVTNSAGSTCALTTTPGLTVTKLCPAAPVAPGAPLIFSGTVTNTGNVTLTNVVVVDSQPAPNTPVLGPITLAPGAGAGFTGSYPAPLNACSVSDTLTATANDAVTGRASTNTASATCALTTTPGITVTETCPAGPVTAGATVVFGGTVGNSGNITLTNVFVFSGDPTNNTVVLGPITLAPGATEPFTGTYIALDGSNPTTNSTIVTNSSGSITTNIVQVVSTNNTVSVTTNAATGMFFGTINVVPPVAVVDRFPVPPNLKGLTYDDSDAGEGGATLFYTTRKDSTGASFFDTINAKTAAVHDAFSAANGAGNLTFDSLTYAAGDLGYSPLLFYYLRHDNAGVSTFGSITPGGVVGVTADHFVVGSNFDYLTYTATDIGYGANLFYYVRHDATGLSTLGTINPALPGTITDRFTVGTNVIALVFTSTDPGAGYEADNFYYLRRGANGLTTFGTISVTGPSPTTATVTDRFVVGTNATELTFTTTDAGNFGPNLFYFLREGELSFTTNIVTVLTTNLVTTLITNTALSYVTNSVITFTATNTVRAVGMDTCQGRAAAAAANCLGPVALAAGPARPGPTVLAVVAARGVLNLAFPAESGMSYTVQYKDSLDDPAWTDLETVVGQGGSATITDPAAAQRPMRFYRVMPAQ